MMNRRELIQGLFAGGSLAHPRGTLPLPARPLRACQRGGGLSEKEQAQVKSVDPRRQPRRHLQSGPVQKSVGRFVPRHVGVPRPAQGQRRGRIHVASVHEYVAAEKTFKTVAGSGGVSAARSKLEATYATRCARNIWADTLG
jgi:hypothetical protein